MITQPHDPRNDVVLLFGPDAKYELHIPIKELNPNTLAATAFSFMEAGVALKLYATEQQDQPQKDEQKLFDWMAFSDKKSA